MSFHSQTATVPKKFHFFCSTSTYRYNDCQLRLNEMERAAKELGSKLEEVQVARSTAEGDLAIEKQWRASLQVKRITMKM